MDKLILISIRRYISMYSKGECLHCCIIYISFVNWKTMYFHKGNKKKTPFTFMVNTFL